MTTIHCRVLLFAQLADEAGHRELCEACQEGETVGQFLDRLQHDHPVIRSMRSTLAIAVNNRFVNGSHVLRDGDEVALIPPVSGG